MGSVDTSGRRQFALLGVGVAVAAAIWGVVEVLGESGNYGAYSPLLSKLFLIVVAAALFGPVVAAGIRLSERQKELAPVGYLVVLLGLVAFAEAFRLALKGSFLEGSGDDLAESLWIIAIAAGQIALLLSWPRRGDRGLPMAAAALAVLATIGLAIVSVVEISSNGPDVSDKIFGFFMVTYLLGLVVVPLLTLASPADPASASTLHGDGLMLDRASLLATDPAGLARFYAGLLGEEVVPRGDGSGAFTVGRRLTIWELDESTSAPGRSARPGPAGLSFVWPGSPESAAEMLRTIGAAAVSGPVEARGALGAAASVNGRDPEGNSVELVCYRR